MTPREAQQYEVARHTPPDILAMAAIDQAENCTLSESTALQIAAKFYEAAERARERRLAASEMPLHPDTYNFNISG